MGLVKLNGNFQETKLIEGWESLIWTERYTDAGEFELHTPDIAGARALIPEGQLVALEESNEVMFVENHELPEATEDTSPLLKITGRSFETVLERRALRNRATAPVHYNRTAATAAQLLINTNIISGQVFTAEDAIPLVAVDLQTGTYATESYIFDQLGEVYSAMVDILRGDNIGIRNIRPAVSGGSLTMRIYDGVNRTAGQSLNPKVILNVSAGHLKKPKYLWSFKNYKNIAYVNSPIGFRVVAAPGVSTSISGMSRRVLQVDASDLTDPGDDTIATALNKRGKLALAEYNKQAVFEAELADVAPYKYGTHFNLGDKITFKGLYEASSDVYVSEYIRSWGTAAGYQEYPGFTLL